MQKVYQPTAWVKLSSATLPLTVLEFCHSYWFLLVLKFVNLLRWHWASSTGLTAVSNFKPRLPAQWAVGTHRIGPSRMEKSNFENELTNQKLDSISKLNLAYRHHHNVKPIISFYFQKVLQNTKQFCSLENDHIITEFPWVVTMAPSVLSADILRWPVTSHWHHQDDCYCGVFAISEQTK